MQKNEKIEFSQMNTEEKLNDLNTRLAKLEKIEHRRKIWSYINLGFKLIFLVILIFVFFKVYDFVKSYKEKLDKVTSIEEKLGATEGFLDEQLENINKYLKFDK